MNSGFTPEEQKVMNHVNKAWNTFLNLEPTHPSDLTEFHYAIHLLQQKLAMRILRRDYPDYWGSKPREDEV